MSTVSGGHSHPSKDQTWTELFSDIKTKAVQYSGFHVERCLLTEGESRTEFRGPQDIHYILNYSYRQFATTPVLKRLELCVKHQ